MGFPIGMPMKAVVSHLATAYGVPIGNAGQLRPVEQISRVTLDAAFDCVDDFRALCGSQFNHFLNFLRGLDQGGNAAAKLLALRQINRAFACQARELPNAVALPRWTALGAACNGVAPMKLPHLAAFYASRNAGTALRDVEAIFHTANQAGQGPASLDVMQTIMARNGDPSGVTTHAIVALATMLASHRPMSGFTGFPQWGPGDHGNPAANLEGHFLKHVCRQPVDVEFGIAETMTWWEELRIRLCRQDYVLHAVNPLPQVLACFIDGQPLAGAALRRFHIYQGLQNQPGVLAFLKNQAMNLYRDFAIDASRVLRNVIVHSNGTRVFISGSFMDTFVIGRLDGGQLGISSCYRPSDLATKLQGARSNMCWPLR